VAEPPGGAHRDPTTIMQTLRKALMDALSEAQEKPIDALVEARFERLMAHGKFKEAAVR
jgi:acetyl-CoA carboxylase carboxyl transferase subunit alpha